MPKDTKEYHLKNIEPSKYKIFQAKLKLQGKTIKETLLDFIYSYSDDK